MCGLFTLVNWKGARREDESWAAAARERLRLRGPDHQETKLSGDGLCVMAHTRLSILDPRSAADQPMLDAATGVVISYNGEIYNFPELRRSLSARRIRFATHCDTEVILNLYLTEGLAGLQRLRGMFAFTIWDPRTRFLIAARDPFGIKPLYVWRDARRIVLASQVRAISCGLRDAQEDPEAMIEYGLFGHVAGLRTPVRGIEEIPPGSILCFAEAGERPAPKRRNVRQLFDLNVPEALEPVEVAAALEESVSAHTLSDVPIGILLSAGTDSAVVASRLAASADPSLVTTFTIGFKGAGVEVEDEGPRAAVIADALNFPNQAEGITPQIIEENLDAYFEAMDQPTVDAVNTFFASQLVHKAGVKVALTGTGGDELFGGYPTFRRTPFMVSAPGRMGLFGARMAAALGMAPPTFNADKLGWMRSAGNTVTGAYLVQRGLMEPASVAKLYDCDLAQSQAVFDRMRDNLEDEVRGIEDPWSAVSFLETRFYLIPRLLRDADWAGMAHSVELRTPLVDWILWRRIRSLIAAEQHRKPRSKRELMSPALAPGLLARIPSEKLGFSNPYRQLAQIAGAVRGEAQGRAADQQRWAMFVLQRWQRERRGV